VSGDEAYLTAEQAREFITTTLADEELDGLLLAATREIEAPSAWGPYGSLTETHRARPNDVLMRLNSRAASITSITEDVDGIALELDEDDYELTDTGEAVRRLTTGTNPQRTWRGRVHVEYEPPEDMAERQALLVKLVEQDLNYAPGMSSTQIAAWSESQANSEAWNYRTERAALLQPRVTW
jgi:hypothetical protein